MLSEIEQKVHERKMEVWRQKYPWASAVMADIYSQEQLLKIWETLQDGQ